MNYRSIIRFTSAAVLTLSAAQVFIDDFFEEKGVALNAATIRSLALRPRRIPSRVARTAVSTTEDLSSTSSPPRTCTPSPATRRSTHRGIDGFDAFGVSRNHRKVGFTRAYLHSSMASSTCSAISSPAKTGRRTFPATLLVHLEQWSESLEARGAETDSRAESAADRHRAGVNATPARCI